MPGIRVGHCTVKTEENHTGVTVIVPGPDNAFAKHYTAAAYIHNGFGKSAGVVQVEELGTLETPIALTNTLNVGKVLDAMVEIVIEQCRNVTGTEKRTDAGTGNGIFREPDRG